MADRHALARYVPSSDLNLSALTLATERTSTSIGCTGYGNLSVYVNLSARTAATAVLVAVDASPDAGTTWMPLQSESISSGTGTLSDYTASKAVTGVDTFLARFNLDDDLIRIRVSGTAGAAGDVFTAFARLSNNRG